MATSRRSFLAAATAAACRDAVPFDPAGVACDGGIGAGLFVRRVPFTDEPADRPIGVAYGEGLDARLVVDLSVLATTTLVQPADGFYLRTAAPTDLGDVADWGVTVDGLVAAPRRIALDELLARVEDIGVAQFECSGNGAGALFGLMSAGVFAGVPLSWALDLVELDPAAVGVRVSGRDAHPFSSFSQGGASWVLRLDEAADAWLVTHQDGVPLLPDHGHPVRLWVPGWYGCSNIKWVDTLTFVGEDEPATSQMMEFAARTHQDGVPALARDYAPPASQCSATAVRVEEWQVDGEPVFRVIGLVWGGLTPPTALHLWMDDEDLGPVDLCAPRDPRTWGLWQAFLPPHARGTVTLRLTATGVPALRLDLRYYDRAVTLS